MTALLAFAALGLSCDNGKKPEGGAATHVTLKGRRIDVSLIAVDATRRHAETRFTAVDDDHGHLLAWPRERFMKLETAEARASFDVLFLDRAGKIVNNKPFVRGEREGVMPAVPAAHALFLAPGLLGRLGVRIGDAVDLTGLGAVKPEDLPVMKVGDVTAFVELAVTEPERQHGLMFRPRMSEEDGMLFVYPYEGGRNFWMGNTLIPLDIAFFTSDGTLLNVNETPMYPDPRNPPANHATSDSAGPARLVLEMNLGWFKRKGLVDAGGRVKPGTRATFPPEALQGVKD